MDSAHFALLVIAALMESGADGSGKARPDGSFGPVRAAIHHPCAVIPLPTLDGRFKVAYGENVQFTIGGKVLPVVDKGAGPPGQKFLIELHGDGTGATSGFKYVLKHRQEYVAPAPEAEAEGNQAPAGNFIISAAVRVRKSSSAIPAASLPYNAALDLQLKVSHTDGKTMAWVDDSQGIPQISCPAWF
jgi:hypothetical protein